MIWSVRLLEGRWVKTHRHKPDQDLIMIFLHVFIICDNYWHMKSSNSVSDQQRKFCLFINQKIWEMFMLITKQNKQFLQCKWHPHHQPPDVDSLWKTFTHIKTTNLNKQEHKRSTNKLDPQDVQAVVKTWIGKPRQPSKCAEKDLTQTLAASPGWQVDLQSEEPWSGTFYVEAAKKGNRVKTQIGWSPQKPWMKICGHERCGVKTVWESILRRPQHVFRTNRVRRNTDCCLQKLFTPYPDKKKNRK